MQAKTAKSEKVPVHLDGQNMETDFLAGNFVEHPQPSVPVELKGNMANILPRE